MSRRWRSGRTGCIEGMKPGAAYFDLSTNSPSVVKTLHAAFAAKGAHMLDAPVSGGPQGAASGKLAIWVGGEQARRSTSTRRCSTRSATRPPISVRSAPRRSPSWCTTCPATPSSARSPRRFRSASRPASSRSRCGTRCARARRGGASPSTRWSISSCRANTIRRRSRSSSRTRTCRWPTHWAASSACRCACATSRSPR